MKKVIFLLSIFWVSLANAQMPGQPIGGIVVKGGKNPGGQMMAIPIMDNGRIEFTITEGGSYVFSVVSGISHGKSINEKGLKPMAEAAPGQPIGGIVVKGGKNPGGQEMSLVTDQAGRLEFKHLDPGTYQFYLIQPGAGSSKSISEKGVSATKSR